MIFIKMNFLIIFLISTDQAIPQQDFVERRNNRFYLNDEEFRFLGFNAYYLHNIYFSEQTRDQIDHVFETAAVNGIRVIRTWAFHESNDFKNQSAIRKSPYYYSEYALQGLDFVVKRAKDFGIRLILVLANNNAEYGGIQQYIEWANLYHSDTVRNFTHADFFSDPEIKSWYKDYLNILLNRVNIYTGISYKDEPAVMSFELMNEAQAPGLDFNIILNWYKEMSRYFKNIDTNHLLTTGEIGYDSGTERYSDITMFYNSSGFLFNGYYGTSYFNNSSLPGIDYTTFHLYPEAWQLDAIAGNTWIKDHIMIADDLGKPALLGEFGTRENKEKFYRDYFQMLNMNDCKAAIVWNYIPPKLSYMNDPYSFNEITNAELFSLFSEFVNQIDSVCTDALPEIIASLEQNYPNPFNPSTTIKYSLKEAAFIKLELFNIAGDRIAVLDEGIRKAGNHMVNLSFDMNVLASGVYIYRLITGNVILTKKFILLK